MDELKLFISNPSLDTKTNNIEMIIDNINKKFPPIIFGFIQHL